MRNHFHITFYLKQTCSAVISYENDKIRTTDQTELGFGEIFAPKMEAIFYLVDQYL